MVRPARFERATSCSGGKHSIQLSYGRIYCAYCRLRGFERQAAKRSYCGSPRTRRLYRCFTLVRSEMKTGRQTEGRPRLNISSVTVPAAWGWKAEQRVSPLKRARNKFGTGLSTGPKRTGLGWSSRVNVAQEADRSPPSTEGHGAGASNDRLNAGPCHAGANADTAS